MYRTAYPHDGSSVDAEVRLLAAFCAKIFLSPQDCGVLGARVSSDVSAALTQRAMVEDSGELECEANVTDNAGGA